MASSLEVSRRFASSATRLGSARARSRVTGAEPDGPTPFPAGGASTGAFAVKLAHAILSAGAVNRARQEQHDQALQAYEKSDLELRKLRTEADQPRYSYRTPSGQLVEGLTGPERVNAEDKFYTPTKPAPTRATIHLHQPFGRYAAGAEVDPAELTAEMGRLRNERIAKSDAERGHSARRYTAAVAELRAIDQEKQRRISGAHAEFDQTLNGLVAAARSGGPSAAKARSALGLDQSWSPSTPQGQQQLDTVVKGLGAQFDRRMGALFDKLHGYRRKPYEQTIQNEGATLMAPPTPAADTEVDPATQAMLKAIQDASGGGGGEGP